MIYRQQADGLLDITVKQYRIQGFVSDDVANFLGVPYASIPARFGKAQLLDPSSSHGFQDATRYGPRCPQPVDVPRTQRQHLYEGVQQSESLPVSEFDCLNLNIYASAERPSYLLPVLVWIHGGGFVVGDGGPEYDGNFLVKHSIQLGKPICFVGINYRLGHFGFLNSEELRGESVAAGELPISNNGLHDQRLALQWIKTNIHLFGGDNSNICIAGESAGAWSVLSHLHSNVPVCQRAIIMSAPALAPLCPSVAQKSFDELVRLAGINVGAPSSEKVALLQQLSEEELISLGNQSLTVPTWDPNWFTHSDPTLSLEQAGPLPAWLHSVVLGHTKDEYALFGIANGCNKWSTDTVIRTIQSVVPDPVVALQVLDAYNMTPTASQAACFEGLMRFGSDAMFGSVPGKVVASHTESSLPMHLYRFDQPDEFPLSPFHGYSYHALDNAFVCRLLAVAGDKAPPDCKATADTLSRALVHFMHGIEPWQPYKANSRMIFTLNGAKSALVSWNDAEGTWRKLATTPETEAMMRDAARRLLSLMSYSCHWENENNIHPHEEVLT